MSFFAYETLLSLKKRSKSTFQPMKCAVSGSVWKHPEWILSVFTQFDEGLDDFRTIFASFWPILAFFELVLTILDFLGAFLRLKKPENPFFGQKSRKIEMFRKKSRIFRKL